MSKSSKATLLDVDPSIIENSLLLESQREHEQELERMFPNLAGQEPPSKLVRPSPGLCIKTRQTNGTKVFINVCHTDSIPPPEDISEDRLAEILGSDDVTDYRVPMSVGNPRQEPDKSGTPADVYDVAINDAFFKRLQASQMFRGFVFQIVFEAVMQKYEIELMSEEFVVLRNRKAMGALQQHRIQQREVTEKLRGPLIQEITASAAAAARGRSEPASRESKPTTNTRQPPYRLIQHPSEGQPTSLVGEFQLPDVMSAKELALDVGEDRITLEARRRDYLLDIFVPLKLDSGGTRAEFDVNSGMLKVTMPVVA